MMSQLKQYMWEILVPYADNKGKVYPIQHHWDWDIFVKRLTGGLTIHQPAKGEWTHPNGSVLREKMIPVRVLCTESEIEEIIRFTMDHYDQDAILAYEISNNVKMRYKR